MSDDIHWWQVACPYPTKHPDPGSPTRAQIEAAWRKFPDMPHRAALWCYYNGVEAAS